MNDDRLAAFAADVEDGSLSKGFMVVSRSKYWTPWMVRPVEERIEIGLFEEFLGYPRSPAFSLNWTPDEYETRVEVRAPAEAWRLFSLLEGLDRIIEKVGGSIEDGALSVDDVCTMLVEAGFSESKWEYLEEEGLPLPPEEPLFPSAPPLKVSTRWGGFECEGDPLWVGPHIGRTTRFLALLDQFIAGLNSEGVAAQDIKAGYMDSAFHRLWECIDFSQIDADMLAAGGWESKYDVPIALTDTKAYLTTAAHLGDEGYVRSGGYEGAPELTLLAPISQVVFQIYEPQPQHSDYGRFKTAFRKVADAVGLKVDWTSENPIVSLPDTSLYRDHAFYP